MRSLVAYLSITGSHVAAEWFNSSVAVGDVRLSCAALTD